MGDILAAAFCFAFPPLYVVVSRRVKRQPLACPRFFFSWFTAASGGTGGALIGALCGQPWLAAASFGASALLALVLWWLSRRKGKRKALRALGAKARARLASMVRNMPKPGPVLRPVPQAA